MAVDDIKGILEAAALTRLALRVSVCETSFYYESFMQDINFYVILG